MAYDLSRCPQTEDEFCEYFFTLIQRAIGTPCSDWHFVMTNSNIPPGFSPGVKADASYPLFGLTQQFSNGPKGRIFLPSNTADENGYFTRCIQYLDDAHGSRRRSARHGIKRKNFEDFSNAKASELVWAWYWVAGNEYTPVEGATGGGEQPIIIVPGGGMKPEDVQAMIDASIAAALAPVNEAVAGAVKIGDSIALRMNSGLAIGVVDGGPVVDGQPIDLVAKTNIHAWESLKVEKGE